MVRTRRAAAVGLVAWVGVGLLGCGSEALTVPDGMKLAVLKAEGMH